MTEAFDRLLESDFYVTHKNILQPLIDYFEDTRIGRYDRKGKRRPAMFSIELWSYEAVKDGLRRTNNAVEGWHRGLYGAIGGHHPEIGKFIKE